MASAATRLRIAVSAQGQTIEDVYNTHAPEDSHGSEAFERQHGPSWTLAAQAIALLPLDAEACLAEGVDPHDLYERSLEDFREHGVSPQIVRMRFDTYARLRLEKMDAVRRSKTTIEERARMAATTSNHLHTVTLIPEAAISPMKGGNSPGGSHGHGQRRGSKGSASGGDGASAMAMMESEARRLEKVQARQQRELAQMIATEMRLAAMAEEEAKQREAEAERKAQKDRERQERLRAEAEEKKVRELKKKFMNEAEEKRRREMLAQLAAKEQQAREIVSLRRAGGGDEAVEKAELTKQRMARKAAELEERLKKKAEETQDKLADLEMAEEIRRAKAAKAADERARAEAERLQALAERQAANRATFEEAERAKKRAVEEKEKKSEERRAEREAKAAAERAARAQEAYLEAQRRQLLKQEAGREEATRLALQEARESAEREAQRRLAETRARTEALRKERSRLEEIAKIDALERVKAREEYKRELALRDVEAKLTRAQEVAQEKQKAIERRKELGNRAKQQKEAVIAAMEHARQTRDWKGAQESLSLMLAQGQMQMAKVAGVDPGQWMVTRSRRGSKDDGRSSPHAHGAFSATTGQPFPTQMLGGGGMLVGQPGVMFTNAYPGAFPALTPMGQATPLGGAGGYAGFPAGMALQPMPMGMAGMGMGMGAYTGAAIAGTAGGGGQTPGAYSGFYGQLTPGVMPMGMPLFGAPGQQAGGQGGMTGVNPLGYAPLFGAQAGQATPGGMGSPYLAYGQQQQQQGMAAS